MAADEPYLHPHAQIFDNLMIEPSWDFSHFPVMSQSTALQTADGPFLKILEQPKQRGFRFRYGCEGPSHGGLPGACSEKNRKSYPTVKVCNYQGPARVVVQLVTAFTPLPHLHAHSLVGKQCDKGICIADLPPKDSTLSFPNLGILHVTKKNVVKTLEERMLEAFKMGYNCGVSIHPEIDGLQGEVRVPRELTDVQHAAISSAASLQAKDMDLSVVRLMFTAFLLDSDGGFSRRLEPVLSEPIYDSKAPNASNLKIVRMDRTAGCVSGGEEIYLLCDKVQKDKEEVQRKRQKMLPNFHDLSGHGGGGGLYRGGGRGGGGGGGAGGGYFQGFSTYNYGGAGGRGGFSTGYTAGLGPGGGEGNGMKHVSQGDAPENGGDGGDSVDALSGLVLRTLDHFEGLDLSGTPEEGEAQPDRTACSMHEQVRQLEALFQYSVTGDSAYLLAPQRPLLIAQDEDGDTGLHLAVLHSQQEALRSLTQVVCALPGEEVLNIRNHLYQTPLHLAVITQQKEAVEALLLAGADPTLTDRHGNTVLHLASQQDGGMVDFLLQHREMKPLLDTPNMAGLFPIHMAVLANQLSSLRELLEAGANVEVEERSCGRTALHLATEMENVSLAGCLLLEGNAQVDCCNFNGSTPLHVAAGRSSIKLTALLMAAGADPQKENFEPLFYSEEEEEEFCTSNEDRDDEGYVPGTTPLSMATTEEVLELLSGKGYKSPQKFNVPPQGDLSTLTAEVKEALCRALETEDCWEDVAHSLGLGILNTAFRLSPSPAGTLLDSYEVSGGTVQNLLAALRSVRECGALGVLEGALHRPYSTAEDAAAPPAGVQNVKADVRMDSGMCDSGVELSTA
ncbi:nuclear factor NF-kappa-B p105 subunit isoform X2 [Thalassophryne amazonica]|uniref:nuclear factor NF-kappa-B p105 subunit isoform X2 n=1 Tax=Thalassophryne amazonica TaxID=390379 RepID=UPI001470CC93|nr:nuclear factor NF-kappa-B p105 subunit isoform X2 [Thalassophryne amazonica]